MKKTLIMVGILVGAFIMIPRVNAANINVSNGENLSEKINSAKDGDVLILEDGTYTGNITIDKNLTIKGTSKNGTIIDGQITVEKNLTLDTVTVQSSYVNDNIRNMIKIVEPDLTVEIDNSVLAVKGYVLNTDYKTNMSGIRVDASAENTTLNVTNTEIYSTYAIYVKSGNNKVTIDKSSLNGWAALDISNNLEAVSNNSISVSNSTLIGVDYLPNNGWNDYSVVQIGAQKNLALSITSSTVKNIIISGNRTDVIGYSDSYSSSSDVTISIADTDLINTDENGNSSIINYGVDANVASTMLIIDSLSTMTSANGKNFEIAGNNSILTLSTLDGNVTITVPTGTELTEDILNSVEDIEGYKFDGWFTDAQYTNPVAVGTKITEDTTIYAKFTKIETPATQEISENIENPKTSDNILSYIILSGISLTSITFAGYKLRKRYN